MALSDRDLTRLKRKLREIDVTRDLVDWIESAEDGTGLNDDIIELRHMTDDSVDTDELVDDCLSADAAGRAKMEAAFFGAGVAASENHFANDFLPSSKLVIEPLETLAQYGYAYIRFVGDANADNEQITIDGRVYELVDVGTTAPSGTQDVVVDCSAGTPTPFTDAQTAAALVIAINGDAGRSVDAIAGADGESVILVEMDGTTGTFTLATTVTGAVVSEAVSPAGQAAQDLAVYRGRHVVTAENVLKLALGATDEICIGSFDDPTGAPNNFPDFIQFYDANGVDLPTNTYRVRVVQVNTDNYAVLLRDPAGAARLALNSEVYWQVTVPRA